MSCNQFAIIFGMLVVYFVNYMIMGDHQNPVILKDAVSGVMSVSPESDMWSVYEVGVICSDPKPSQPPCSDCCCSAYPRLRAIW